MKNQSFEFNLCMVLAHTIVHESKVEGVTLLACGPDAPNISEGEKVSKRYLADLMKMMPDMYSNVAQGIPQIQGAINAQQLSYAPKLAELQTQMYAKQAPRMAQVANQVSNANAASYLQSQLANAQGVGGAYARSLQSLDRELNPEWYAQREAASRGIMDQLANPVTGGEMEAIQRGINAQGVGRGYMPNNTGTVAAAQLYGNAYNNRLNTALDRAIGSLPAIKSNQDIFSQASGDKGRTNAASNYSPVAPDQSAGGSFAGGIAGSLLGAGQGLFGSNANYFGNYQNMATANDPMNRFGNGMAGALPGLIGSKS